jgi:hypothetical protein
LLVGLLREEGFEGLGETAEVFGLGPWGSSDVGAEEADAAGSALLEQGEKLRAECLGDRIERRRGGLFGGFVLVIHQSIHQLRHSRMAYLAGFMAASTSSAV